MNRARDQLVTIYKGRAIACWIMCAGVIALGWATKSDALHWLVVLALLESTLNQPLLYPALAKKVRPIILARLNIIVDIIIFTYGLHFFGGYKSGILISGYMLIMLYAFLAVRPREGIIATVVSIAAFAIMYLLESKGIVRLHPALDVEKAGWKVLIIITMVLLLIPAYVGRNIYSTILAQEIKLQKALDRGLRLFTDARDAMLLITPEARVEQANPKAAELFNQPLKQMRGRMLTEILAPESTDDFAVLIQNVSTGQQVFGSNLRLRLPDGAERLVEVSAMPFARERGTSAIFIVLRDVTERRRLEGELKKYSEELELRVEQRTAELEESKERYQSTFEKAAVPLAWLDPDGTLQSANKFFYGLTGLDKNMEGKFQLVEILDKLTDREQVAQYLILHRKGYDAPTRLELAIRTGGGKILFTEWFIRFEPLTDQLLVSIIDDTERRLAEKAMRESEEKYRALVETSPDSIVVSDLEGKVVMANRQALRLYGCAREEELLGLNSFDFVAPEERKRALDNAMKVMETGRIQNIEYTIIRKDGTPYPGEVSASLIRDAEGRPKYFIGVTRDISNRKKIENARKESEKKYRSLFEQSRDVIYITTREGTFLDINPAATELFGYERSEMIGMDVRKIYADPADRDRFKKEVEQKGAVNDYEVRFSKKDGTIMDCLLTSTLRRDASGNITGYQGIIRDVTERKRAEEALKESEARYRLLVDTSPDAIVVTGQNGIITMLNEKALKLFGAEAVKDVQGRKAYEFIAKDFEQQTEEIAQRLREFGSIAGVEFTMIRKDGSILPVELSASIIRDGQGAPAGFIGVIRDITDRKRVEMELTRYRERLEELVERRTAELTAANEQLKNEAAERERAEDSLRESEAKYRALFESAPETIAVVGLDGTILDLNTSRGILTSLPREERIGKPFSQVGLIKEKDVPGYADLIASLIRGEKVQPFEVKHTPPGGDAVWLEIFPSALKKDGKVHAIQVMTRDITARKRADQALRESEERYRLLANNVTDLIWTADLNLQITYISPSIERLRGYTVEEAFHQTLEQRLTPESLRMAIQVLSEEMEIEKRPDKDPKRKRTLEFEERCKDGSTILTEASISFLRDPAGNPVGFLGVTRDITQRKRTEAELNKYRERLEDLVEKRTADLLNANENLRFEIAERVKTEHDLLASERKYSTLFQDSRDAVYLVSTDGRLLDVNQAAVELSGYSREELLGMNVMDLYVDPRQRDDYREQIEKTGAVRDYEVKLRDKDGRERDVIITSTLWRGKDGEVLGFHGIIRDITDIKRTERAIRESEQQYRTLVETSPDAIIMVDLAGNILTANRRALELWGGPGLQELIGQNAFPLVAQADRERAVEKLASVVTNGQVRDLELTLLRHDGSEYPGEASGTLIRDSNNRPSAIIVAFRDIIERRRAEQALRQSQDQLLQAEHMAGVGQIAAGVAHDMNSPLTAISYYSQALEKLQSLKKADRENVKRIEESVERIQRLLARIINYASTKSAEFEPVDLNTLVRQVLDALSHEIETRPNAGLKTRLDDKVPKVNGSAEHLFDLISNLVINALQALGTKKGQVTVSTRLKRGMVELMIADTGVGIPKKDLPDIFTPFVSRRKDAQGTGLGLAIVQRIARLHGGDVKVKSEPGKGTTFTVSLPPADNS
ncbi:MAG TPA: PAS domain S-box protein [bacterium]|nr:PAS domain S-box protein [bacterium]